MKVIGMEAEVCVVQEKEKRRCCENKSTARRKREREEGNERVFIVDVEQ